MRNKVVMMKTRNKNSTNQQLPLADWYIYIDNILWFCDQNVQMKLFSARVSLYIEMLSGLTKPLRGPKIYVYSYGHDGAKPTCSSVLSKHNTTASIKQEMRIIKHL